MARPLEGITAAVLGTGPDLPADRLEAFGGYFTIGVNRFWRIAGGFRPTAAFWIDGAVAAGDPQWPDGTLLVCDASAAPDRPHERAHAPIAIPARAGPLPRRYEQLSPRTLYHRPNAGVVAALWAASLGCWPVVLLGMGCENDGRSGRQLAAMRAALEEAVGMEYRRPTDWRNVLWPWPRRAVESPAIWASYVHSQRLTACGAGEIRQRLRSFYAAA